MSERAWPLLALMLVRCGDAGTCGPQAGRVGHVRDGDTVVLDDGDVVRYLGIDTPERGACFGTEAVEANAALVVDTEVRLADDVRCRDVYARRLAYVSIGDLDVGGWLLEHGLARLDIIPPNEARATTYRRLVEEARAAGRGLWSACR